MDARVKVVARDVRRLVGTSAELETRPILARQFGNCTSKREKRQKFETVVQVKRPRTDIDKRSFGKTLRRKRDTSSRVLWNSTVVAPRIESASVSRAYVTR